MSKTPEPLLTRAGIITALSVLSALCVHLGAVDVSTRLGQHNDLIASVLLALGPAVTGLLARAHVTPVVAQLVADVEAPDPFKGITDADLAGITDVEPAPEQTPTVAAPDLTPPPAPVA